MTRAIHDIGNALNIDLLHPVFVEAVQKAWCREACWPGCIQDYPQDRDDNPSFGNCLVTTLAAWAARGFQDDIIPGKVDETAWHFRLGVYGYDPDDERLDEKLDSKGSVPVDPTWQQFESGATFRELEINNAAQRAEYKEVVTGSLWDDETLIPRLQVLLDRLHAIGGYDVGYRADEIVGKARCEFKNVRAAGFVSNLDNKPGPVLIFSR